MATQGRPPIKMAPKPKPHIQLGAGGNSPAKPPPTIPRKSAPLGFDTSKPMLPTKARPIIPPGRKPTVPSGKKPPRRPTIGAPSVPVLPIAKKPVKKAPVPKKKAPGTGSPATPKKKKSPPVPAPARPASPSPTPVQQESVQEAAAPAATPQQEAPEDPASRDADTSEDSILDENGRLFSEEEKRVQREKEKAERMTAEKSVKQQLQEETHEFVRGVKISYLEKGVDLENHTQQTSGGDMKPHKVRFERDAEAALLKFGPYSDNTGRVTFSTEIKDDELESISTTFLFSQKHEGLCFSLVLKPELQSPRLDFVAFDTESFENVTEGLRALSKSPLRMSSLKEIKMISDWNKKIHNLDAPIEEQVLSEPPPVPPEPPMDFVTPFE